MKKGDVRAFFTACGSCHTRVLDDGTVVPGAQGNLNESHYHATRLQSGRVKLDQWKETRRRQYGMPWLTPDPAEAYQAMTLEQAVTAERSVPAGVRFRIGASHTYAPKTPDSPSRNGDLSADVIPVSVGTDPRLAMRSRKGTGYYRVPSLKGVWYRGPFEHNGSVPTLEEWFDPARLSDAYIPTGARGVSNDARPVPGHRFGLDLPAEDKRALVAFLRTL